MRERRSREQGIRERENPYKSKDIFGRVKKALIFALPNKNGVQKEFFFRV